MSHPNWVLLHPRMTAEHLGPYVPYFLVNEDPRPAAQQFNERYQSGWRAFGQDSFRLLPNNTLLFPGDPPQKPIAWTQLREEVIVMYAHDVFAIIQPDRSFEVSRMD